MKKILTILLTVGVVFACASAPDTSEESQNLSRLQGKWLLTALEGNPFTQTPQQKEAFIEFDTASMQVSGNSSVNQFGGSFTVSEPGSITFSPMRSTLMAGLNMETENLLYKAFPRVTNYTIKGAVLSLFDADGALLIQYTFSR